MLCVSSGRELLNLHLFQPSTFQDVFLGDVVVSQSFLVLLDQHLIMHFGSLVLDLLDLKLQVFNFLSVLDLLQKISLNPNNFLCFFCRENGWLGVFWTKMRFDHCLSILQVSFVLLQFRFDLKIQLMVYLFALSCFGQSVQLILKRLCFNGSLHLLTQFFSIIILRQNLFFMAHKSLLHCLGRLEVHCLILQWGLPSRIHLRDQRLYRRRV